MSRAVDRHDTAALFDRLMYDFSFQGISDEIAANYMAKHGQATWGSVHKNLASGSNRARSCKATGIFTTADTRRRAAPAPSLTTLPLARCQRIGLRNGHLNQMAYSLYLFIRDVADGDLVGWIDDRVADRDELTSPRIA